MNKRTFEENLKILLNYATEKKGYCYIYDEDINRAVAEDLEFTYDWSDDLSEDECEKREELARNIFAKYVEAIEKKGYKYYYDNGQDESYYICEIASNYED